MPVYVIESDYAIVFAGRGQREALLILPRSIPAQIAHGIVNNLVAALRACALAVEDQRWRIEEVMATPDGDVMDYAFECRSCGSLSPSDQR